MALVRATRVLVPDCASVPLISTARAAAPSASRESTVSRPPPPPNRNVLEGGVNVPEIVVESPKICQLPAPIRKYSLKPARLRFAAGLYGLPQDGPLAWGVSQNESKPLEPAKRFRSA